MQTLKTAVVVVLLLVVFYGVYEMLNRPPSQPPKEVAEVVDESLIPPEIEIPAFDTPVTLPSASPPAVDLGAARSIPDSGPPASYAPPSALDARPYEPADTRSAEPRQPPAASRGATSPVPPPAVVPGSSHVQHNPYINQDIRNPAASDGSSDVQQIGVRAYERARKLCETQLEEGRYHDTLNTLSIFYKSQDLSPAEHAELLDLLDPLAAKVIYSTEHLVQPAHEVRRNETLMDVAEAYDVPWRLLQKINGIEDPRVLLPGSQLKVVTGPFRAEVDVEARELTLFLGRLYAGRFAISVGSDSQPIAGDFKILDKLEDRDYFAADGRKIPAGDPSNPYGKVWMDIGRECAIHGSPPNGQDQRGCISLSPLDADDVSSILSIGSTVRIYR